jgi:beta-galactosidase beta subunit
MPPTNISKGPWKNMGDQHFSFLMERHSKKSCQVFVHRKYIDIHGLLLGYGEDGLPIVVR